METCPANTPGVGDGLGPWFWCVPRRSDLRAVRDVFMPRHTPYEEDCRPARACAGTDP